MVDAVARILIVDDQVSYRDALVMALGTTDDLEVVGVAGDAAQAKELCAEIELDLLVTDYRLPGGATGTVLARELRELGVTAPIVVLTGFLVPQVSRETSELPGVYAVSKDESMDSLLDAIRSAANGDYPATTPITSEGSGASDLSDAELEVLELLNNGRSPADIAEDLFLSLHTIRARIKSIHRKLGVSSQVEAIAAATRMGLLAPPT